MRWSKGYAQVNVHGNDGYASRQRIIDVGMAAQILVVDDDRDITGTLRAYLEQAGYVSAVHDGTAALASFRRDRLDLVVLDLGLPEVDGLDVACAIRRDSDVPIIMVTARVDEAERLVGLELGADDYVAKSFSPREVVAWVKAVLRRASGQRPQTDVIRGGPILLNRAAHAVTVNDAPIELTRTEFAVLDALMQNAGRTLNRLQLIEQALGYSYDGYDCTIDAHISNLRHKLEPDPRSPAMWLPCTAWDTSSLGPSMRASLFVKLLIAFGLVVLVGTGLMLFLANGRRPEASLPLSTKPRSSEPSRRHLCPSGTTE